MIQNNLSIFKNFNYFKNSRQSQDFVYKNQIEPIESKNKIQI